MKSKFLICCYTFFFFSLSITKASQHEYAVSNISSELSKGAVAVVQKDSSFLQLTQDGFLFKSKKVITILNERGRSWGIFSQLYNNFSSISNISGKLYDSEGNTIGQLKKNKIEDISTFGSSFVFHDDLRRKIFSFDHNIYPYTVEYEFTMKSKGGNFMMPNWVIQPNHDVAVKSSSFHLLIENAEKTPNQKIFNKPVNIVHEQKDTSQGIINYWSVENINAFYPEYSTPSGTYLPFMALSPKQLTFSGYNGNSESWQDLGKFFYEINKGRDQLPPNAAALAKQLTDGIVDEKGKIATLYKYVQANTRYVANEYGLAGWQTFPASEVFRTGYGDCKGLSNYMKALLSAVNIKSYLVLVSAGEDYRKMDNDFINYNFNHMILCVPLNNDTIWLECTSTTNLPGYLGSFTQNRNVLLLTPDGGTVAKTPSYDKNTSYIKREVEIWLNPLDTKNKVNWKTEYAGMTQDEILPLYQSVGSERLMKERLNHIIPYQELAIEKQAYQTSQPAFGNPNIIEIVNMNVRNFTTSISDQLLVEIPIKFALFEDIRIYDDKRENDFELHEDRKLMCQFKIHLPEGYSLFQPPSSKEIKSTFGNLNSKVDKISNNILLIELDYAQNKGIYKANVFEEFKKFNTSVSKYLSTLTFSLKK